MTQQELVDLLMALPETQAVSTNKSYWKNVASSVLPMVIDEIVCAFDWDFAMREYESETTVADTAEYTLRGANNDLRDIMSIRYGSDRRVLYKYRTLDMDDIIYADQAPSSVFAWYQHEVSDDGFPVVVLVSTPSTTGEVLYVRYRRNNITLRNIPDEFGYIVALGVMAWLNQGRRRYFERQMRHMMRRYKKSGKDTQIGSISPRTVTANNTIADLYGTG